VNLWTTETGLGNQSKRKSKPKKWGLAHLGPSFYQSLSKFTELNSLKEFQHRLLHNDWLLYLLENPVLLPFGLPDHSVERPGHRGEGGLAGVVLKLRESEVAELNVLHANAGALVAAVDRGDALPIV
jgi:hypothetical protein